VDTVCLITAPITTDFEDPRDATSRSVRESARNPKLGVLALASVLIERAGAQPFVFDLDRAYADFLGQDGNSGLERFPIWVAEQMANSGIQLFGFSSICSSYPLTLRVAEAVKRVAPGCTILLGGPQASVVDRETLAAFPYVDYVLRGESDLTLPLFVDAWQGKGSLSMVPGLTFRSPFGPRRNPDPPPVDDLDALPLPAFHLTSDLEETEIASLELGRGCPYACTFCSTNDFFRRKFRVKAPERMLADMRAIANRYGIRRFDLVHDMFTVDRRRVVAFCEAMIGSAEGFLWSCSARTDSVDKPLLELMAKAGCEGIFFGVEAGSAHIQTVIDKDLDVAQAKEMVALTNGFGIRSTVSMIAGFPEETEEDLRGTLDMVIHSLRHVKSTPQFHILAPLAGTPIQKQYKDEMVLDELCSDASHQGHLHNASDRELIRSYPQIFSNFYLLPTPRLERSRLLELREFMLMASAKMRWLLVALHRRTDILDVFDGWREHREVLHPGLAGWEMRSYYMEPSSRDEFVRFIDERTAALPDPAVEALTAYYKAIIAVDGQVPGRSLGEPVPSASTRNSIPVRKRHANVLELDWDIQRVIDGLKRGELATVTRGPKYYRTDESIEGVRRLIEITPLVAKALELCDGNLTAEDFIARMAPHFEWTAPLRRYAAECLLEGLREEGLIAIYRPDSAVSQQVAKKRVSSRTHQVRT
jgi:radical SAM superfamily enzyme YgiQ (UPF0313 family)